jgi:hypothetical protein
MPETFKTAAAKGFETLGNLYRQCGRENAFDGYFWLAANALQTCLEYLLRSGRTDDRELLVVAETIYRRLLPVGWWRDDFGWWGNAFVLAWSNRQQLGYAAPVYDDLFNNLIQHSLDCAQVLNGGWSDEPYGIPADHAGPGTGAFPGGVYNVLPAQQPPDKPLTGRNSVTNELFWLLCQALQEAQPGKGPSPDRIKAWFYNWLGLESGGLLAADRAVVLERPRGWIGDLTWCWTGDQGLLFRALTNAGDPETAHVVAFSAFAHMADDSGILFDTPRPPSGYLLDYATGKGVLMRHLVWPGDPPLADPMPNLIMANASAVWINRLDKYGHQFGNDWSGAFATLPVTGPQPQPLCNIVMQASGQDALNAALLIAPDGEIPGS